MIPINALPGCLHLGRQMENNITDMAFDISTWLEQWPGLVCHITHARGGEPYLVTGVLQVDNTLIWTVGGDCTQESGY